MKSKLQDELDAESHHGVGSRDSIANEETSAIFFDLRIEPVKIIPGVGSKNLKVVGGEGVIGAVDIERDKAMK